MGIESAQKINNNSPEDFPEDWRESKDVLTYEQFIRRFGEGNAVIYNNFLLFFSDNEGYISKRESNESFRRFRKEYPELEQTLTEKISAILKSRDPKNPRAVLLKDVEPALYEAYRIMMTYEETPNNYAIAA